MCQGGCSTALPSPPSPGGKPQGLCSGSVVSRFQHIAKGSVLSRCSLNVWGVTYLVSRQWRNMALLCCSEAMRNKAFLLCADTGTVSSRPRRAMLSRPSWVQMIGMEFLAESLVEEGLSSLYTYYTPSLGSRCELRWLYLISEELRRSGFPGRASGKEPACQCRRHKTHGFNPWVGKIPRRKE